MSDFITVAELRIEAERLCDENERLEAENAELRNDADLLRDHPATDELKPCPFCGGEAFIRRLYMTYIVDAKHDDNCPLSCRVLPYDARWCTRVAVQAAWNRRADHD